MNLTPPPRLNMPQGRFTLTGGPPVAGILHNLGCHGAAGRHPEGNAALPSQAQRARSGGGAEGDVAGIPHKYRR